jgi:hypothetical protein
MSEKHAFRTITKNIGGGGPFGCIPSTGEKAAKVEQIKIEDTRIFLKNSNYRETIHECTTIKMARLGA